MRIVFLTLPAILLLPFPAAAGEVQAFPAKGADLAVYKTYRMLPTRVLTKAGVKEDDPDISPLINDALKRELAKKGLTEVPEGADMEVAAGALDVSVPQLEAIVYNINM